MNQAPRDTQQLPREATALLNQSVTAVPLLIACLTMALTGCDSGPVRYSVSGRVLCDGQPVSQGKLLFTPDRTAGNSGGQGVAVIENGRIATQRERKLVGGPQWMQIIASDGVGYEGPEGTVSAGKALFPILDVQVPLPRADAVIEVNITRGAGDPKVEVLIE